MNPQIFKTKFAAICLATAIAGTGITLAELNQAHGAPAAEVVRDRAARAPRPVDRDADRYAERETQAQKQEAYQGGNVVIVGISTTAAILILVIVALLVI